MDEIELVKAVGDVWDDTGEIIESMHALRKRIEALYTKASDEALADIYKLANAQVDLVQTSLRVTLARIESSVRATMNATLPPEKHEAAPPERADAAQPEKVDAGQPERGNGTQATIVPVSDEDQVAIDHDREVDAAAS